MRAGGVFQLLRPVNAAIAFLSVVAGAATVTGLLADWRIMLGALSASLVLMSGNAINDVYDLEADRVNKPYRPLPRGDLTRGEAQLVSLVLATSAVVVGYVINFNCFLISLLYSLIFYFYAIWLKPMGFLGNVIVSSGTGVSLVFGALAVDWVNQLTLVFALCAFILNLGREVVKGVEDIQGDKVRKVRTVAIQYGVHAAGNLVVLSYAILLPISLFPFAVGYAGIGYFAAMAVADCLVAWVIREARKITERTAAKVSGMIKIAMAWGLFAFLVGALLK
ncbi:MAG: geranylgeranylglycerol-phosphate geranylgeranyltransferase [archaeon]